MHALQWMGTALLRGSCNSKVAHTQRQNPLRSAGAGVTAAYQTAWVSLTGSIMDCGCIWWASVGPSVLWPGPYCVCSDAWRVEAQWLETEWMSDRLCPPYGKTSSSTSNKSGLWPSYINESFLVVLDWGWKESFWVLGLKILKLTLENSLKNVSLYIV